MPGDNGINPVGVNQNPIELQNFGQDDLAVQNQPQVGAGAEVRAEANNPQAAKLGSSFSFGSAALRALSAIATLGASELIYAIAAHAIDEGKADPNLEVNRNRVKHEKGNILEGIDKEFTPLMSILTHGKEKTATLFQDSMPADQEFRTKFKETINGPAYANKTWFSVKELKGIAETVCRKLALTKLVKDTIAANPNLSQKLGPAAERLSDAFWQHEDVQALQFLTNVERKQLCLDRVRTLLDTEANNIVLPEPEGNPQVNNNQEIPQVPGQNPQVPGQNPQVPGQNPPVNNQVIPPVPGQNPQVNNNQEIPQVPEHPHPLLNFPNAHNQPIQGQNQGEGQNQPQVVNNGQPGQNNPNPIIV